VLRTDDIWLILHNRAQGNYKTHFFSLHSAYAFWNLPILRNMNCIIPRLWNNFERYIYFDTPNDSQWLSAICTSKSCLIDWGMYTSSSYPYQF
jgi:hypothetical protein